MHRLAAGDDPGPLGDPPDLRGYVDLILQGGFPDAALQMSPRARTRWLEGYVDQLLTRDAIELDPRLLTNLFVVEATPAWASNRLRRLSRNAKRYLVDPALVASVLRLDARAVLRDGDLLGRLLDTFVVAQLRAELATSQTRPRFYHVREEHGRHEIDVVAEIGGRDLVAFEVKATAAPDARDARHLAWLRERLGARFLRGVVFHTGPRSFELSERISARPICALWG